MCQKVNEEGRAADSAGDAAPRPVDTGRPALLDQITAEAVVDSATGVSIIATDRNGVITLFNRGAELMLGYSREELIGKETPAVFHLDSEIVARGRELSQAEGEPVEGFAVFTVNARRGEPDEHDWTYVTKDGLRLQVSLSITAIRGHRGEELGFLGVARDVTLYRSALESLRSSERRYRTIFERSSDGIVIADLERRALLYVNPALCSMLGHTAEALVLGLNGDSGPAAQLIRFLAEMEAIPAEQRQNAELPYRRRDNGIFHAGITLAPIEMDNRRCVIAFLKDVTRRKQAEKALRESQQRWHFALEGAGDGVWDWNAKTGAVFFSAQWRRILGLAHHEAARSLEAWTERIHPEDRARVYPELKAHLGGRPESFVSEHRVQCVGGQIKWILNRSKVVQWSEDMRPLRVIGTHADITERKEAEARIEMERRRREQAEVELRQAQKLEAVGQLAAGIAHEINTPMQYIGDSVHFLRSGFDDVLSLLERIEKSLVALAAVPGTEQQVAELRDGMASADISYLQEQVPRAFDRTLEGVERVSAIVRAMRAFAHPDQKEKAPADLNQALRNALTVSRNEYKYVAEVETDFHDLPPVVCHLGELNQVFLNLIINAAHAIGQAVQGAGTKGSIRIRTRAEEDAVRITVEDTGCGIPLEIRDRVFEPFFTTKPVGKGTGQGLAIARSIVVEHHGGKLTFDSEPGRGTAFHILLPIRGQTAPSEVA